MAKSPSKTDDNDTYKPSKAASETQAESQPGTIPDPVVPPAAPWVHPKDDEGNDLPDHMLSAAEQKMKELAQGKTTDSDK
jgi:hypothetical protein